MTKQAKETKQEISSGNAAKQVKSPSKDLKGGASKNQEIKDKTAKAGPHMGAKTDPKKGGGGK
jgi:hypothetical protein